jgi:predicted transcriptional regulator
MDLQSQREEAIQHLHIQQAYIEDLDKFVNERVEENQEISKQVQNFASQVAQETEQTLRLLEERLKSTIEEKEKVEESLLRASKVIRELTEEARRQRVTASRFITHIYQVLSIPPGDSHNEVCELRTLPYVVLSDNIINSIDEDSDMAHTYAIDTKIHMKELLKRVIFWSRQFELQKKRLRERVTQLEQFQAEQKKSFMEEIDRYRKKCSFYRDILRQLRRHIGPNVIDESLQKILPPKIYEQAGNWLNKNTSPAEQVQKLLRGSSSEELTGDDVAAEADIAQPSSNLSQAQNKFGQSVHLNPRPFISTNLHTYLRKHERFIHILDNVEKYLSKSEESVEAVDTMEDELE